MTNVNLENVNLPIEYWNVIVVEGLICTRLTLGQGGAIKGSPVVRVVKVIEGATEVDGRGH